MKVLVVAIGGLGLLMLTGCGHHAARAQTVEQFERANTVAWAHEQWGKVYETLYPAQQKSISYKDFAHCMIAGEALTKGLGPDPTTARFVSARVTDQERITIPGSKVHVRATVVSVSTSMVENGKRADPEAELDYLVKLNGQWRWVDPTINYKRLCGIVGRGG